MYSVKFGLFFLLGNAQSVLLRPPIWSNHSHSSVFLTIPILHARSWIVSRSLPQYCVPDCLNLICGDTLALDFRFLGEECEREEMGWGTGSIGVREKRRGEGEGERGRGKCLLVHLSQTSSGDIFILQWIVHKTDKSSTELGSYSRKQNLEKLKLAQN